MFGGNNLCSLTESSPSNDETQLRPACACVPNLTAAIPPPAWSTPSLSLQQHQRWENIHKSGRDSHNLTLGAQKYYGLKDRFFNLPFEQTKNNILAIPGKFRNIQGECCYTHINPEDHSINRSDLDRWYRLKLN